MPVSNSRLSFSDCYQVFDEALAGKFGARVPLGTKAKASFFRLRMHQARNIDRRDNREIYPDPLQPLHGRSIYDPLQLQLREDTEGGWWVYAIKTDIPEGVIERLEGDAAVEFVEYTEVKFLEDQTDDNQA